MTRFIVAISVLIGMIGSNIAFADCGEMHKNMKKHPHKMNMKDTRISLGLPARMKQHQLTNMRSHLEAIKSIVGLMSENKFDDASKIAHTKLGLTPEMREMCKKFDNEEFKKLGLAFHKSGDDLGDTLQTKDINASLQALSKTMQYCVECHATYRQ